MSHIFEVDETTIARQSAFVKFDAEEHFSKVYVSKLYGIYSIRINQGIDKPQGILWFYSTLHPLLALRNGLYKTKDGKGCPSWMDIGTDKVTKSSQ